MIEFNFVKGDRTLVKGTVKRVAFDLESGLADYVVDIKIDRGSGSMGEHRRKLFGFDPNKHNALGLFYLAMESMDEFVFEREATPDTPTQTDWLKRLTGGK